MSRRIGAFIALGTLAAGAVKMLTGDRTAPAPYDVDDAAPWGPVWARVSRDAHGQLAKPGTVRPYGLPPDVRRCSRPRAALGLAESIAERHRIGQAFTITMRHLCLTESGGMFGRPADTFDARATRDAYELVMRTGGPDRSPHVPRDGAGWRYNTWVIEDGHRQVDGDANPDDNLITAWGCYQFNRDAIRELGAGVAWPWLLDVEAEVALPVGHYARIWRQVAAGRTTDVDCAAMVRLYHRSPRAYGDALPDVLAGHGALATMPASHRSIIKRHLTNSGLYVPVVG